MPGQIEPNRVTFEWFRLQPALAITKYRIVPDLDAEQDQEQCANSRIRHVHHKVPMVCVADTIVQPCCKINN